METKRRKPTHPGIILEEHYIKPLNLNLQELADHLGISRNTLFKLRCARASVTPNIALILSEAFDTTPELWLNLQQKYDLWVEENEECHEHIAPIFKKGILFPLRPLHTYATGRKRHRLTHAAKTVRKQDDNRQQKGKKK